MPPVQDVATFLAMRDQGLPLLDVRSPGEFAFAHIPGALNLPLFTDEERAKVGTAHARSGREGAVHLALELVGGHLAALLARARHLCGSKREVLLHCWRGGMRSDSMRWLLETGGFTVHRLESGYKSYRTFVRSELARPRPILVLGGYTGCVGVLDTGRPGPVTTLRFDIDCLAIEELFDANKLDQKTLEATFARYNELTQPARTPTSAAASTRKQSHRQSALLRLRNEPEGPSLHGRHGHERRDRRA